MNVLSSIRKNFDLQNNHAAELSYTYNNKRDLVSETYEQSGNSLTVNYGRDAFGRISQKYTGTTSNDVYQTFTYNNRNLLETAKSVDPTNTTSTLSEVTRTYDSFGNIKSETFDSGTVSSAISWNSSTKVMTETTTLPTGKNIVETAFSGRPQTLEYDGTKLLASSETTSQRESYSFTIYPPAVTGEHPQKLMAHF